MVSLTLPAAVKEIGFETFSGCSKLKELYSLGNTPADVDTERVSPFTTLVENNCTLYVPRAAIKAYKSAPFWCDFSNILAMDELADGYIYSDDRSVYPEQLLTLPISLRNKVGVKGLTFDMELPEGFEIVGEPQVANRASSKSVTYNKSGNIYSFMVFGINDKLITGDDGVVLNIRVRASSTITEGEDKTINISNIRLSDEKNGTHKLYDTFITLTVGGNVLYGDVNLDGEIDIADVTTLVDYVIHKPVERFNEDAADVNADGDIDIADVTTLVDYVIHKITTLPYISSARIKALAKPAEDNLCIESAYGVYSVLLNNENQYKACQFEITLPAGEEILDIALNTERCGSHSLVFNKLSEGRYAVAVFSLDGDTFNGDCGELLSFRTSGNANIGCMHFVNNRNQRVDINAFGSNEETGITNLDSNNGGKEIYDLGGRQVSAKDAKKGVYIINNKKTYLK